LRPVEFFGDGETGCGRTWDGCSTSPDASARSSHFCLDRLMDLPWDVCELDGLGRRKPDRRSSWRAVSAAGVTGNDVCASGPSGGPSARHPARGPPTSRFIWATLGRAGRTCSPPRRNDMRHRRRDRCAGAPVRRPNRATRASSRCPGRVGRADGGIGRPDERERTEAFQPGRERAGWGHGRVCSPACQHAPGGRRRAGRHPV